jgi:nucleotide-binding universal stress UspA family protein
MTTILVTTDFSTNSKSGIRFALQLASQMPCKLVFYHALELLTPTAWRKEDAIKFVENAVQKVNKELDSFIKSIIKQTKIHPYDYKNVVDIGMGVDSMIVNYAKEIQADYICMSTRGAGILKKLIGTNASTLVNTSPIPVIIVPHNYRIKPIKKVGYASDFENIDKELKTVANFATALNVPVEVYHFYYELHKTDNKKAFEAIKTKYETEKVTLHVPKLQLADSLVKNLQHVVRNKKPTLLFMFTKHKDNWFERFFFESKTAEMTYDINIPLIAIRK